MSIAMEAFQVLASEHGPIVSVTSPSGVITGGIASVWNEQPNQRTYDEKGERTVRMGQLLVDDSLVPAYQVGEQWTVRGEVWQVHDSPNFNEGIRIYTVRRDDKVKSTQSRTPIL